MNENKNLMSSEELLTTLEAQAESYRAEYEQLLQQSQELNERQQKIGIKIEQIRGSYTTIIQTINTMKGLSMKPQQTEQIDNVSDAVNDEKKVVESESNSASVTESTPSNQESVNQTESVVSEEDKETIKKVLAKSKAVKKSELVNREDVPDYLMPDYEDKIKQ